MEKRVIKFNLVGAIAVLILIIALIVGLIIGIPKLIDKVKVNKNVQTEQQKKISEINENTEFNETVVLQTGEERECRLKYLHSQYGYAMKYDADLFYAEKNVLDKDHYYSLYSNSVGIIVEKKEGDFFKISNEIEKQTKLLIEQNKDRYTQKSNKNVNKSANQSSEEIENKRKEKLGQVLISTGKMDGHDMIKSILVSNDNTEYAYYIKIDDNHYYYILMYCSKSFEVELLPIMEHMINSFVII